VKPTSWSQGLSVTADGSGVVPLAGAVAARLLAERVGLTERCRPRWPVARSHRGMTGARSGSILQSCSPLAGR
jgi:hypothetical protein